MQEERSRWIVWLAAGLLAVSGAALADDTEALAKAAQNPIANMISVPFQNNTNFNVGPQDKTQNILNIQPVIPVNLNAEANLITRTIIPVISQPAFTSTQDRENGIGDIQFSAFYSPKKPAAGGWIWGAGLIAQLDTATDDRLGQGAWGLGPTAVALKSDGPWLFGALINNVWSVAEDDNRSDVNQMLLQPFVNYNFKDGWYATSGPIVTANWKADSNDRWTVPLGGGFGKIFKIGDQAMNGSFQAFYNVVSPDNTGGNWTIRAQLQLLFPK